MLEWGQKTHIRLVQIKQYRKDPMCRLARDLQIMTAITITTIMTMMDTIIQHLVRMRGKTNLSTTLTEDSSSLIPEI